MLQSGLDEHWWQIPWHAKLMWEIFKISCLMEDSTRKTFWRTFWWTNHSVWFAGWVFARFLRKTSQESIKFGKKVLPGLFSGYALYARGIWKGDVMVADIEELETMDASETSSKRLNAKEVIFPKENGKSICPVADERIKLLAEMRNWEHPTWYGNTQFEEKVKGIFLENQNGLFHHLKTHFRVRVQRYMIYGPCEETSYTAITLNLESNFTRREKNHSLFHWNTLTSPELHKRICILCKKAASMTIGISMDQEICLILDKFHSAYFIRWKTSRRVYVVGGETDKTASDIQAR